MDVCPLKIGADKLLEYMKNKKSLYILLPLVIIIWGTLFWKIFVGSRSNASQPPKAIIKEVKDEEVTKERVELNLNYEDPFLKSFAVGQPSPEVEKPKPKQKVNRVVAWPMLEYHGLIKSHSTEKTVGMLNINNKKYLVHNKEVVQGISVVAIFPDSIVLINQSDQRSFKRNGL